MIPQYDLVDWYRTTLLPRLRPEHLLQGLELRWTRKVGVNWRAPCPIHGGKNPSFVFNPETLTWFCHSKCGRGGGPLELLNGGLPPKGVEFGRVVQELAVRAGVTGGTTTPRWSPCKRTRLPDLVPKVYPEGAAAFWRGCTPVSECQAAVKRLESWGMDAGVVRDYDLARVVPVRGPVPDWATCRGRKWSETYRLVFPLFAPSGQLKSLRGRPLSDLPSGFPKSVAPAGVSCSGLVLADGLGRQVLETGQVPTWWTPEIPFRVVVTEGEKDFLTWAINASKADEFAPGVVGIAGGGWSNELGARVPVGTRVVVRTDQDEAGERYFRRVRNSLNGCRVFRPRREVYQ